MADRLTRAGVLKEIELLVKVSFPTPLRAADLGYSRSLRNAIFEFHLAECRAIYQRVREGFPISRELDKLAGEFTDAGVSTDRIELIRTACTTGFSSDQGWVVSEDRIVSIIHVGG